MNTKHSITVPISELTQEMTVELKISGLRWWMFRIQLAMMLIHLSAWICPVPVKIEEVDE